MNNERYEFKSISPKKKKPGKERKYGIIVVLLLLVLLFGAIAIVVTRPQFFFGGSPANFVDIPVIETHLMSADGNLHMFGTRVVIELDNNATQIDLELLYGAVSEAVSGVSYEDISAYGGMETLRNAVRTRLAQNFDEGQLLGVYFAQFLSDMPLPNLEEERIPGRNPLIDVFLDN
jgi:flagellar basal body-associated protein FliL